MESLSQRKLAVVGQGYVGLPLAMAAVEAGWTVIGIDSSSERIKALNLGKSPVEDIADEILESAIAKKMYVATNDFSSIVNAEVVTICVPTPLNENREPDLSALENAAKSIAPYRQDGTLVASESTSYPGTLRSIVIPLIKANRTTGENDIYFAAAPERVNPGDKKWNQKNTPRLVGGIDSDSQELAMKFYSSISENPISVSSPEVA